KTTIPLDLLTAEQETYSPGVLIYGGISSRGLIPNDSPNDGDSKHRSHYALEQIDEIFNDRVKPEEQADNKMADIWPIKNISGYIKQKLEGEEIKNIPTLKTNIIEIWRTISPQMCSKLMNSIPRRLQCLINKEGYPVN
ncbi:unnamed protein product, partial [Rotaria sp. Silwood1]